MNSSAKHEPWELVLVATVTFVLMAVLAIKVSVIEKCHARVEFTTTDSLRVAVARKYPRCAQIIFSK